MVSTFNQALLQLDRELDVYIAHIKTWSRVNPLQSNMELCNMVTNQQAQQVKTKENIAISVCNLFDDLLLVKVERGQEGDVAIE